MELTEKEGAVVGKLVVFLVLVDGGRDEHEHDEDGRGRHPLLLLVHSRRLSLTEGGESWRTRPCRTSCGASRS